MADQKKRPTAIHIENCDNVTLKNNVGIGEMDLIVAKNSKNITGSGNKIFVPNGAPETPMKRWFEKPIGIIFLGLVITVIGSAIAYYLGWN